ncbi:hypothetical protein PUNSTDRAFT_142893 [Punctularia strigosozonata HHB-11173 SS5]|uniref:uncharacterized protein n=1 Tax=Punctularia strigosozonata (strain HHB-11173) TaxID=741275 RepID=UPI0004416BE3|nr:uncharacterized protein PUNSTDRAFT_142893 [Punctularia strigosozonata HHB-11173 SS5]EIN11028.1 hypothetical protein PUNSTDRAFT_142893 [Punctularia strigosozonata HHB-11173 SS5]
MSSTDAGSSKRTAEEDVMRASVFQRLHPRAYLERFLAEGIRPDGRDPGAFRDVTINVGSISTADGSALVRLGDTTIVCGVKAEIAEPDLNSPSAGFLVPNIDLPAICSPKFKPGPPSEEAQVLSEKFNDILTLSGLLPLESLCIHPGKSCWVLYVDATCINYDGNAFDAALIAMVSALKDTSLPKASYDEDSGRTTCSRSEAMPLPLRQPPVPVSFGLFNSNHLLADPTSFEEPLLDTTITVIHNDIGELVNVTQLGLASDSILSSCIDAAKARSKALCDQIYA